MVVCMSTTLSISDTLAAALEARRAQAGLPSIDVAAELLLSDAMAADALGAADLALSDEALKALIVEGEASGPVVAWEPQAVRKEVQRRFAARKS